MSVLAPSSRPGGTVPALSLPPLSPHALADIAAGLAASVTGDEVRVAPGELRGFVRLLESPSYEAWLIAWAPSGALELHDHGGSAGALHVVRGELVELFTDAIDRRPLRSRPVRAGQDLPLPATRIHEVWNPGPRTAVSVHVYSPRIRTMTFFDGNLQPVSTVCTSVADG